MRRGSRRWPRRESRKSLAPISAISVRSRRGLTGSVVDELSADGGSGLQAAAKCRPTCARVAGCWISPRIRQTNPRGQTGDRFDLVTVEHGPCLRLVYATRDASATHQEEPAFLRLLPTLHRQRGGSRDPGW